MGIYFTSASGVLSCTTGDNPVPDGGIPLTPTQITALNLPTALQTAQTNTIRGNPFNAQPLNLAVAYSDTSSAPVGFTSAGGVTKTYQADPVSIANLQHSITGCQATDPAAPATPTGFYWVAADNTQVPFAYADLLGLAAAIFAQGAAAFAHLQAKKAEVLAATTVAAVQAITW